MFDCFLVQVDLVGVVDFYVGEDVWMMLLYFVIDCMGDVGEGECVLFVGYLCVEDYLQQQIVQFVFEVVQVIVVDCVGYFVGFFDGIWGNVGEVLLQVLWVFLCGIVQVCYDLQQVVQFGIGGYVGFFDGVRQVISCVMVGGYCLV